MAKKEANIVIRLRDRASSGFRKLAGAVGSVLKPIGLVAAGLTAIGTLAGGAFLRGAIRSAGEFDEALSAVGAVTGATADEMVKLRDAADEAAGSTRFTATEAAGGLEELSRAGFSAAESVQALNPVLNLASGNNQSVAESAIQVTTALNAFGLQADQSARIADVFTRAAQRSAQTTSQLGQAMSFVAPVARQAGLSVEETSALIGRLADAGFRGSRGGTALRNALSQLQDPASTFSKALSDAGIESRNFIEVIEQLAKGGDKAEAAIRALGLEAAPAIQSLVAGGVPALQQLTEELKNAEDASTDAATAMEDNLPGALRSFGSAFDQLRRRLVAPLVIRIKEEVQDLTGRLREFTASGIVERFARVLVDAFDTAKGAVEEFIKRLDFQDVQQKLRDFADTASESFKRFRDDASVVRRTADVLVGSLKIVSGAFGLLINTIATGSVAFTRLVALTFEQALKALDRFTFGLSDTIGKAVEDMERISLATSDQTGEMAARVVASLEKIKDGWSQLTSEVEKGADRQARAIAKTGEAAEDSEDAMTRSTRAIEVNREEIAKHLAVVRGWDRATKELTEKQQQAKQSVQDLGEAAQETGNQQATAGDQAAAAAEQQEQAAGKALTAWLDFGDGLEQVTFQLEELAGTATSLDQLREQAEAATPPIERLREAIEAASTTDQLDQVVATMGRLREEGLLTEDQYAALTDAVLENAAAMREATTATDDQAESLNRVSREAVDAADSLNQVSNAARGASRQAKQTAGGFGAILDQWRELGPDANRQVDEFIKQVNAFPQLSFSAFRTRLARFTQFMADRFGAQRDAAREAREEVEDFERGGSTGTIRDGNVSLTKNIVLDINVKRDPQGPLQLSEVDINTIVGRVLAQIEGDQARGG